MIKLKVCVSSTCHLNGGYNVLVDLTQLVEKNKLHDKVEVSPIYCMNTCDDTQSGHITVMIGDRKYVISSLEAKKFFEEKVSPLL